MFHKNSNCILLPITSRSVLNNNTQLSLVNYPELKRTISKKKIDEHNFLKINSRLFKIAATATINLIGNSSVS